MIKRDNNNIVVQHSLDNPLYADGGDSCARTGILAASGSIVDINNLPKFVTARSTLVRHPLQPEWNDDSKTSRDNVVQFCAAEGPAVEQVALTYAKLGKVNKDWLSPSVRLYLYACAKVRPPVWLVLLGHLNMLLDLIWNSYVRPEEEINQFSCMCIKLGRFYSCSLLKMHKNLEQNLNSYWSGWRDQPEIGQALLKKLKQKANN